MDNRFRSLITALTFSCSIGTFAHADTLTEWRYTQPLQVPQKGLTNIQLPLETLSAAQPTLGDVRVIDPSGQETAYVIDQPQIQPALRSYLIGQRIEMANQRTVLTGQVPPALQTQGYDTLMLTSQTPDFLKPVTLEASSDRVHWTTLVRSVPVYRQAGEVFSTHFECPKTHLPYLRITLDDRTTPPIRLSGVMIYTEPQKPAGLHSIPAQILETIQDARQTDVRVLLPADNLTVGAIHLTASDGTFQRHVSAWVKTYNSGAFQDVLLGQGLIYRVSLDQKTSQRTDLQLGRQIPGRIMTLHIDNGDSRPLTITQVSADIIPAHLIFDAPTAGAYTLYIGNPLAAPKTYDVAPLRERLAQTPLSLAQIGALTEAPGYHAPEPLPQVGEEGTEIDLAPWHFRKKLTLSSTGIQRIEPDLQVLGHNDSRIDALRVVRQGKQLPYVIDQTGSHRELPLSCVPAASQGSVSRWTIQLPQTGLPLTAIEFSVKDPLFQRSVVLYEQVSDERGEISRRDIGNGAWTRTKPESPNTFTVSLTSRPQSNQISVETNNGDNAPIQIVDAKAYYQTPRILFKAAPDPTLYLYYGNADAVRPQYDLELIAKEILSTPPAEAALGAEEILKVKPWWEVATPNGGLHWIFWIVLSLVVLGLLGVIAKLLPESDEVSHGSPK